MFKSHIIKFIKSTFHQCPFNSAYSDFLIEIIKIDHQLLDSDLDFILYKLQVNKFKPIYESSLHDPRLELKRIFIVFISLDRKKSGRIFRILFKFERKLSSVDSHEQTSDRGHQGRQESQIAHSILCQVVIVIDLSFHRSYRFISFHI
jgi:hypothetical protein